MAIKNQSNAFRIINGVKYSNYCDLAMTDEINAQKVAEAKAQYNKVRKIKNTTFGFYQLFVSEPKN